MLQLLGLPSEQHAVALDSISNRRDGNRANSVDSNQENSLLNRQSFTSQLRSLFSSCIRSRSREKRKAFDIEYSSTNSINDNCPENLFQQNPFRVKGSLFHLKTTNGRLIKHIPASIGNKNPFPIELALKKNGLYKIIYFDNSNDKNYCLTKNNLGIVKFDGCNDKNSKDQDWDIVKLEDDSNLFNATIINEKSCLGTNGETLVLNENCGELNFNAEIFKFIEITKSKYNQLPVYSHSIILDNTKENDHKNDDLKNKSNDSAAQWEISVDNYNYKGYVLANNETLQQFIPKFTVTNKDDSIKFNITKDGNIYTKLSGTWGSMPLCLTASNVNEASWQHVGFKPCNRSFDNFQQWDMKFISDHEVVSDVFITDNLKLKNSNVCLRMNNSGLKWGDLFLSKCNEYTDNSYSLKLKFVPTKNGLSFSNNLNYKYKQIKSNNQYISLYKDQWLKMSNNLNWLFRYEPKSMQILGYDFANNNDNSPYCFSKYDGNNYFNKDKINDVNDYVYLELKKCNQNKVEPNEQFLLIKKITQRGNIKFTIYSGLQKNEASSIDFLLQKQLPYFYADPNNILCTGKSSSDYLWMGKCYKTVQEQWNQYIMFEWEK